MARPGMVTAARTKKKAMALLKNCMLIVRMMG